MVITVTLWRDQAKEVEKHFGLQKVGDKTEVAAKVMFEKLSAEGRKKVLVTIFGVEEVKK